MEREEQYIELAGTVKAVLFQNEENGYTVVKLETTDGLGITAVGCLPWVHAGEELILTGEYGSHPSYGEQFQIKHAQRSLPESADDIFQFLASGAIKGVGPATATLLVTAFGDRTLEVIEREPERITEIKGISEKKAREISETFKKQIVIRRLMEFLGNYEIKPIVALRLYRLYGDEAMELLMDNPYIITQEAVGAQFSEADEMALSCGFEEDSPERVAAAAIFELRHNTRNGHCFIPMEVLVSITSELIQVSAESVEDALEILIDSGELVRSPVAGRQAVYLASIFEAESYAADRLRKMAESPVKPPRNLDGIIAEIEGEESISYAQMQLFSLRAAASNRVIVLTGGPGTGKTTTVRAIVSLFDKLKIDTILTAPTGRAAKRMSELTGRDALTIHRLLEAGAPLDGSETVFRRDEDEPLECGAVVLDECSMVDIMLFKALLSALPEDCRLVLVGDADQLPSVGPGNVFNDIIRSNIVETVRLTEIFRQTRTSRIVESAHMINRGEYPDLKANVSDGDFFFLKRTEPRSAVNTTAQLCAERLPKNMGIPRGDIQVLSPTRRGEAGTRNLNAVLQTALNPPEQGKKERNFGEVVFRQGDRVMQIQNNYDIIWYRCLSIEEKTFEKGNSVPVVTLSKKPQGGLGIYNGDVGVIADIDNDREIMTVLYDDRLAVYGFDMLSELEHAFAMTIHKAQGSEYRAVVLLAVDGSPQLMSRRVLYTGVTRARELLIIVGANETVFRMIDNHKVTRRFSGLRARLTGE